MKPKRPALEELRIDPAEFDATMRKALGAPPLPKENVEPKKPRKGKQPKNQK